MHIKRMHTNIGLAVFAIAALCFGATGFVRPGNAAVGSTGSCAADGTVAAGATAASRDRGTGATEADATTPAGATTHGRERHHELE